MQTRQPRAKGIVRAIGAHRKIRDANQTKRCSIERRCRLALIFGIGQMQGKRTPFCLVIGAYHGIVSPRPDVHGKESRQTDEKGACKSEEPRPHTGPMSFLKMFIHGSLLYSLLRSATSRSCPFFRRLRRRSPKRKTRRTITPAKVIFQLAMTVSKTATSFSSTGVASSGM